MTKKSLNKLLSVILTLAICSAAVFGCLITANAEDVTCYEWSEGVTSKDLTSAAAEYNSVFNCNCTKLNNLFSAVFNLPYNAACGAFVCGKA